MDTTKYDDFKDWLSKQNYDEEDLEQFDIRNVKGVSRTARKSNTSKMKVSGASTRNIPRIQEKRWLRIKESRDT